MSKLDWAKAKLYRADPARAQKVDDFVEPDPVIISVRDLTPSEKKNLARKQSRRSKAGAKALLKRTPKAKPKPKPKPKPQARKLTEEEKRLAAEARRVAQAEHQQRYLAKTRRQLVAAASKKTSHLEAWVEKQTALSDRKALKQTWRWKLFGPREKG